MKNLKSYNSFVADLSERYATGVIEVTICSGLKHVAEDVKVMLDEVFTLLGVTSLRAELVNEHDVIVRAEAGMVRDETQLLTMTMQLVTHVYKTLKT